MKEGDRVELHPSLDRWMMGDRYGEILQVSLRMPRKRPDGSLSGEPIYRYKVKLDKSGTEIWLREHYLKVVR